MNKRQSNEMTSIRKKLIAAIAMLLVACIMTVSSTYAWFTLSTAPEVKGITTTVGANGNLEIALGSYETVYGTAVPGAGEGKSMDKAGVTNLVANLTWGNLLDLEEGYGLDLINLYPTRLNIADGALNNTLPLKYASYGNDGRVLELLAATKGGYTGTGFAYDENNPAAGVNAIGSASSISERALALMNYKNAYVGNTSSALKATNNSITKYGSELASLMVQHINAGDTDTNTYGGYKDELQGLIAELQTANDYVGKALKSAVLAYLASDSAKLAGGTTALEDAGWKTFNDAYANKTIEEIMANMSAYESNALLQEYYEENYLLVKEALAEAKTKADALTDSAQWDDVSAVVNGLVDSSNITVCEMSIADIKNDPNTVLRAIAVGGLTVEIGYTAPVEDGAGNITKVYVYPQLANMLGTIAGGIVFADGTEVDTGTGGEPVDLSGFPATLYAYPSTEVQTVASAKELPDGGLLNVMESTITGYKAPASTDTAQGLTDTYGYTVDLLFRTNATDSNLLLQTTAANRIYEESTNAELMGSGSNMVFTASDDFKAPKVAELMKGIRVVFYETPATPGAAANVLAVATLDAEHYTVNGNDVKADLQLVNYSFDANGIFSSTGVKTGDAVITALSANGVKKISALVYLDGDVVDNEVASVSSSVVGTLNLQFASDADLTPMNNSTLMNGSTT